MEPGRRSRGRSKGEREGGGGRGGEGGGLREGEGEGELMKESLPLTLCTYVRIPTPISISYMGKPGSNRDTRRTLDNGAETPVEPGRGSRRRWWWWRGRINEGNTSTDIMYICEITNANLNIMYEEGEGVGRESGKSHQVLCACVSLSL